MNIKESDWKIYKKIKEKAVSKFCQQTLEEFLEIIHNKTDSAHDRYEKLYKAAEKRDKLKIDLFDRSHSRSGAPLQLLGLRSHNLVDEKLLAKLSDEVRFSTNPKNFS